MIEGFPLSPKQVQSIVEAQDRRISIWSGAVRSGKTVASIIAFIGAVAEAPRSGLILIVGRTLQTIERNIIIPMQDEQLMGPIAKYVDHTRGASTATILGRTVHLIGASDARAEGKLRGMSACLAMVDEATLIPEEFWTQLLARLSIPGARCFATTNPGSPAHWLKTKFLDRKDDLNLNSWHFTIEDNPSLEPEYVEALKSEFTGLFYRRFIKGHWVAADGAIFDAWDTEKHIIRYEDLPPMKRLLSVGMDYGTRNASAATLVGLGMDGKLYAIDEWRYDSNTSERTLTDGEISARIKEWLATLNGRPEWIFLDPAALSLATQLRADGVPDVIGANNDVLYGLRTMASLLAMGKLIVSDRCKGLISEFPGYAWDTKASEQGIDKPLKVADHSLDSLRYGLISTETNWRPYVDLAA